ncbi:cilia- and flagella-associated protein 300-like [Hetaerina americana]|uniref:cilia- and flagella-associated protein 300-like n=1 Tax=Hetaerina americana TaxID=62018 RepID=UPI003A7F19DD
MDAKYTFVKVGDKRNNVFDKNDMQELLMKWSIKGRLKIQSYCFNEQFHMYDNHQFILDFFKDNAVSSTLENVNSSSEWKPVGTTAATVEIEQVPCTVTSMNFFDRLQETGQVATKSGKIVKCFGEPIGDFEVWDELRKMLLDEESDNRDLFSTSEKREFIYRLFCHLCLGGRLCQYEDVLEPYLTVTRILYKDLVSIAKDPETKNLITTSVVFKVVAKNKNGEAYFPEDPENLQNFCYLIIDPVRRVVTCFVHQFGGSF